MNTVHLCDCMEFMKGIPDKYYDLAIVDPPYGIDVANMNMGAGKSARCSNIENRMWKPKDWDAEQPTEEFFSELQRVSVNQVIWGGNYFKLSPTRCFVVWDKGAGMRGRSFSECEYAWTSFKSSARIIEANPVQPSRIHPTQKPVSLYKWLLKNYANPGDKIFDSHVGSGSSRIACYDMGFYFEGCEIDEDYWKAQEERYKVHSAQSELFAPKELQAQVVNGDLFASRGAK